MKPKGTDPAHVALLALWIIALAVSAYHAYDSFTWVLEVFPAVIGVTVLAITYRRFPLTNLLYGLIFTHSLWHGGAANLSTVTRKNIQYGYNQLFFRNFDYDPIPEAVLSAATPRQRRLLGDMGPGAKPSLHFYPPRDQVAVMFGE